MKESMRMGRKIGAVIGAIVFLAFGILPGFYFGSFGTLVVLTHLFGGPVDANIIVRMMIVVGTVLGLFCTAAVSIVLGSVFGTAVGYVTEHFTAPAKTADTAEAKAKS